MRFKDDGGVELPSAKPWPGPSKKTPVCTLTVLKRQLESTPTVTAKELKEKNPRLLSEVSMRTVNGWVAELGYSGHQQVKKPIFTKQQKKCRLDFALIHHNWIPQQWSE